MNPQEAVQALSDCGAQVALAHHFGTFQLASEEIDAPLKALQDACRARSIPASRFRALLPGQAWEV
jgi:L-ascorbate metabolism protein UlaG (beta-lactamase superfamily)